MSDTKASVPKFASFRPKPLPQVEGKPTDRVEDRHSSKSKSEKEIKSGYRKRHRSRSRDRNHDRTATNVSRVVPSASDIFIIDRKGDVKNLVYGSIHRYSVPPFRRFGAGYVLGAPMNLRIDRDLDDGKSLSLRNLNFSKSDRREKYIFARVEKEKPRILRLRPEITAELREDAETDFVPLQVRSRKRKRGENSEGASSDSEQETRDYRSIYGKVGRDQPQDPDLQYATESDGSGSEAGRVIRLDASVREKNVKLSRKVDEYPHDIEAWLELIDHQDVLIGAGEDRRRITNAEIRSTAEIKIHMYEKALEKTRSLVDRERLLQGLMLEGAKIWEMKIQADRWEQVAKENIDSLVLWTSYLNFKQSAFSSFRYEAIKELYLSRVKLLFATIEKLNDSTDALHQQIIYVLLRFTLFIRESGYAELSVAVWQGLLEFNFCGPTSSISKEEYIKLFQQFWESEVPRLGEAGALGWRRYVENEDSSDIPESATDVMHDPVQRSQIFRSWAAAERHRSRCSRTPARTMDEVVEDDPFRVILFTDIEDFLILFPFNLRSLCIDAFLIFCGLPPTANHHQEPRNWHIDQFIRNDILDWNTAAVEQSFFRAEPGDTEGSGLKPSFQVMCPNAFVSASSSTIGADVYQQTMRWQDRCSVDGGPVSYHFIQEAIKQLTQVSFTEELAQYHISFEYKNEPETIKKVARGLLKQHPSSLRLYNAYALVEWSKGNKEASVGVFSAALSMDGSSSETETKPDSILLWRSLTWCCLEDSDKSSALKHLLSIPDGVPNSGVVPSPAALLRAKQHLTSSRDFLLSSGDPEHAMLYAECEQIYISHPSCVFWLTLI
jgi:hypothetical protein